jgi:riboflavin kinase/FMN adenylyltransferase
MRDIVAPPSMFGGSAHDRSLRALSDLMAVFRHTYDLPKDARGSVVAIGNFDGVHRGHREVLSTAQAHAARLGASTTVLTFEPHPRQVFVPDQPPFRLSLLRSKVRILEDLGVANLFVLHFDQEFARKTAEQFVTEILVRDLEVRHVVIGSDFCFGHRRQGNADLLRQMGESYGFGVSALDAVRDENGDVISSSRIREALRHGQPGEAARLLGRPWEVEGRVDHGAKRGRDIGFPTANIDLGEYLEPAHGIYAVRAGIDRGRATQWWDAVGYVGRRPTVAGENVLLEVHIFDAEPDLYGQHLRVQMIDFLRGDTHFSNMDEMRAQIVRDCREARRSLASR